MITTLMGQWETQIESHNLILAPPKKPKFEDEEEEKKEDEKDDDVDFEDDDFEDDDTSDDDGGVDFEE